MAMKWMDKWYPMNSKCHWPKSFWKWLWILFYFLHLLPIDSSISSKAKSPTFIVHVSFIEFCVIGLFWPDASSEYWLLKKILKRISKKIFFFWLFVDANLNDLIKSFENHHAWDRCQWPIVKTIQNWRRSFFFLEITAPNTRWYRKLHDY